MGLAMLLIMVHHGRDFIPAGRMNNLVAFLYGGVDFFIFCSGIGCFFSYVSDRNPTAFLKRRAARIFPIYLAFMCYWLYVRFSRGGIPLQDVLGNLLCVQWLTGREPVFNWYMSFLLITYLLSPVFASLAEKADSLLKAASMMLALLVLTCAFWNSEQWPVITTRLPLFFAGMLFSAESKRRERLKCWELLLFLGLMLVGLGVLWKVHSYQSEILLWNYGMYWYPFLLVVPGACLFLALCAQLLERCTPGRWLITGISFVGKYTFEIFVTHCYALGRGILYYAVFSAIYAAVLHMASLVIRKAAGFAGRLICHGAKIS